MPNGQGFIGFVVDQVQNGCEVTDRHMFGGTTLAGRA